MMRVPRAITKVFGAVEQSEGAGSRVRRAIGGPKLRSFSPFLMFDHMPGSGGSFPDHPHRGQETITYVLNGTIEHEDFVGNTGILKAGDLQFMTAGKGIMHSEQPMPDANGVPAAGFQLWVDLPRHLKMTEPRYRDLKAEEIPHVDLDDGKVHVKVISGRVGDVNSPRDLSYQPVWYLDVEIKPGGKLNLPVPEKWNTFAYLFEGSALFGTNATGQRPADPFDLITFAQEGETVNVEVADTEEKTARFLLVAGETLDQPVAQGGPFVMNTRSEVEQAFEDFYLAQNGFERAKGWKSQQMRRRESFSGLSSDGFH